ncbi:thiamine pyrophosphate-binding protein [Rhodococcus sp. IEGM 1381]|uniref:thiamine pyrophosphate-binding protein n=1 Tax=Rhodococcus sp. IEGM 1381 TaxID=3047085 RepID=UPI0024B7618B|nr:thiamine pyrophosphate-binding protein [Rhodococcus sp. IEGM 1381]MDI9893673.1 thiamine pyrophosphate-binding protein [Rhodococcus sp. IEGM 1381]
MTVHELTKVPSADRTARSGAELLIDTLVRNGVDTIFGVPGDTGVVVYEQLRLRSNEIRHVLARDERHAAYMADGYARSHLKVGVCEASSGAGAVYLASGLGEAMAASIPLLVFTTDIHRSSRGSGAITEIDQEALFAGVTKWCKTAQTASDIPSLITEAIETAVSGRPGPVAVVLPEDVLDESSDAQVPGGSSNFPLDRYPAVQDRVSKATERLTAAERPAILAGGGVHTSGAWAELRAFAEKAGIPVATTIHGKGALAEDHPLSLGVAGGNGSRGYANEYLTGSDAILIVGSRANSTDTNGFTVVRRTGQWVAQIDSDRARAGRNFEGSLPLAGDAATVLTQLIKNIPAVGPTLTSSREAWIAERRQAWADKVGGQQVSVAEGKIHPRKVIEALHEVFGSSTWVAADPGTPTPNLAAYWEADGTAWRVVIPRGHGPMGYSISAAIGIAIAHPGERVLCITTEGSLAMGIGDWETAERLSLPITYVVLDNVSFGWIKMLQHLFLQQKYFATEPGPIDPAVLAHGMGLPGYLATDVAQLKKLALESLHREGPTVIHVPVPEHQDAPPPVAPWQAALDGGAKDRPVY